MEAQTVFWSKVKDMGLEFLGDSSIFRSEFVVAAQPEPTALSDDSIEELKRFEFEIADLPMATSAEGQHRGFVSALKARHQIVPPIPTQPNRDSDSNLLEYRLTGIDSSAPRSPTAPSQDVASIQNAGISIDFEFTRKQPPARLASKKARNEESIDDILNGLTIMQDYFKTRKQQERTLEMLQLKQDILWNMLDAMWLAYLDQEPPYFNVKA
jgi:hypothetical protein